MDIVTRSKHLMLAAGAAPIMYLMIGLSIVSLAIIIERAWFFRSISVDVHALARAVAERLNAGDRRGALRIVEASTSTEAAIAAAGIRQGDRNAAAVGSAMESATALERIRLERGLAYLGTLGNNAPFIGLLGTVIGIVQAFDSLERTAQANGASTAVMGAISEALVATAIGLAVAIPAVMAYNYFQRRIKGTFGRAEALKHVLLAHFEGGSLESVTDEPRDTEVERASSPSLLERISCVPNSQEM
jgi:biopolymer transport protein ExbB